MRALCVVLSLLLATAVVAAGPKFRSVWKAPDISSLNFVGKTVAALVITDSQSLQVSAEEKLVSELMGLGVNAIATYRIVPREELKSAEKAKGWYDRRGIQGVVAVRPLAEEKERTAPVVFASGYDTSFWGYYGSSWSAVYEPGYSREERFVSLETLIFDVPGNALVWAGMSTTDNPKNGQAVVADVVEQAVKELQKQGLASEHKKSK